MKKFITTLPLQKPQNLHKQIYAAVDNQKLFYDKPISFPILSVINGYAEPGEEISVIAIVHDHTWERENLIRLENELSELCTEKSLTCRGMEKAEEKHIVEVIDAPFDDRVSSHVGTFQKLIEKAEDNDILYACITYGTKPTSLIEVMALQYAYRIKKNASIGCVVYGQYDHDTDCSRLFDETALVQLDEIVRVLAEQKITNPKEILDRIINL